MSVIQREKCSERNSSKCSASTIQGARNSTWSSFPEEIMVGLDLEKCIRGLPYQEWSESYEEGNSRQSEHTNQRSTKLGSLFWKRHVNMSSEFSWKSVKRPDCKWCVLVITIEHYYWELIMQVLKISSQYMFSLLIVTTTLCSRYY